MINLKSLFFGAFLLFFALSITLSQSRRPQGLNSYNFPLLPQTNKGAAYSVSRTDFTITMRDGVKIDALKFIPVGTPPAGGWPTVIMVHGYGDNKETLANFCRSQAEYGYYTMTFSMRGQGKSGGLSNLISRTEAQDFIEIVNNLKGDVANGINPENILVMGGSQGGLIPFMASCLGLKVKTIISALAPPNFASNWIENGSIKMTFLWTIEYNSDTARYTPVVDRMSDWVYANNKNKWDSLAYWLPRQRDFMSIVPNCQIPLIVEGSWQDKFFNASGIVQSTSLLTVPFRMYLGAVQGHGGDHSPTEDQWHMNFFNDWFLYWLFGTQNGTLDAPKYQYASTTYPVQNTYWTFTHDSSRVWPVSNTSNYRLYFNRGNKLKTTANLVKTDRVNLLNAVTGGLTMTEAVNEEFTGPVFASKFKKNTINFDSDPLTKDYRMTGTPVLNLQYSSTKTPFCQYNFQIYEVKPDGSQRLVNRINYTDRSYTTAYTVKTKSINGQAHSHVFKAGNKIRITITNLDTSPDDTWFLGTNPFVLPVLANSSNYINLNNYTYIDLPVNVPVSDITSENNVTNAVQYSLKQNYPNPFNPSTTIKFVLANDGFVSLKIYDMLGREVKTLTNEYKTAGSHTVEFNAGNFASGVYFYSIESGDFKDIKKMIFIK